MGMKKKYFELRLGKISKFSQLNTSAAIKFKLKQMVHFKNANVSLLLNLRLNALCHRLILLQEKYQGIMMKKCRFTFCLVYTGLILMDILKTLSKKEKI